MNQQKKILQQLYSEKFILLKEIVFFESRLKMRQNALAIIENRIKRIKKEK